MKRLIQKSANLLLSASLALGFTISASALSLAQPVAVQTCIDGFTQLDTKCVATYTFTQGASTLQVPQGLGPIQIDVYGGAGGTGGLDCGRGCVHAPSGDFGHLTLNFSDLSGQTIELFPGDSGQNGQTGANASGGGQGGKSTFGKQYGGGQGGNAGPNGTSGAGGGGGGASVVKAQGQLYVAAGAGGGGGSANSQNGSTSGSTAETYVSTGSNGGDGQSSTCSFYCDGGGGGGGGAGVQGGQGGTLYAAPSGEREAAGFGGAAGSNTPVGAVVTLSEFSTNSQPGTIIVQYAAVIPPQSITLLSTSPTNNTSYRYQVAMNKGATLSAADITFSGDAATQGTFTANITKKTSSADSTVYKFTVTETSKTPVVGDLIVRIRGVSAVPVAINQAPPGATVALQPQTAHDLVHVYEVHTDTEVTNLIASDFVAIGTAKGCQVSSITGSVNAFLVSLSNCGDGTFGLTLKKNTITDTLGNQGPAADLSTDLSDMTAPVVSVQTVDGTIPQEFVKAPVTSIFGELTTDAQTALGNQGVYAPMDQAPVVNLTTDLSASGVQDQIAYQNSQQVDVGSSVDLSVTVSPAIAAVSDLAAFVKSGTTWQFIGRTSFVNNQVSGDPFGVAQQGQLQIRLVIIPKTLAITNTSFKTGFGKGLGIKNAVTDAQTQLSNQIIDLTIDAVPGPDGVPSVVDNLTPPAPANPIDNLLALTLPTFNPGAPVANPGIGATGDDNAPSVPFNPIGSPEAIAQTVKTTATTVAVVSTVAAAAGAAAGAAGAAGSGAPRGSSSSSAPRAASSSSNSSSSSSSSSGQDTNQQDGSLVTIDAEVESFTSTHEGPGDRLGIVRWRIFTFLDRFTHDLTVRLAKFSPVLSKIVNDGAYLRAVLGSFWLLFPLAGIALGTYGLMTPVLQMSPPDWRLFILIAVLGMFDAFSGLLATLIFVIGMIDTFGVKDLSDVRMMLGVLVVGFGPALIAVAFRKIRKHFETNFSYFWERVVDAAVLVFFTGWTVSSMVGTLPALAGRTLTVANHVGDFGLALSVAILVRIVLEEVAARIYPTRLDKTNPTEVPSPSQIQKVLSTALRLATFVFVTAAFMGNTWQVWVGSVIFILPNVLSWFEDRLPNSPTIWKLIPQGVPGLAFSLLVASYTATVLGSMLGHRPDYSQWSFMLMPIPMFVVGLIGLFGREGADGEDRPIKKPKWRWVYRVGGIVVLALTMKLAGVI